jgi:hypothetical protein
MIQTLSGVKVLDDPYLKGIAWQYGFVRIIYLSDCTCSGG